MDINFYRPCIQFCRTADSMDFTYALWVSSILLWIFSTMIEGNALAHDRPPLPLRNKNSRKSTKLKQQSTDYTTPKSNKSPKKLPSLSSSSSSSPSSSSSSQSQKSSGGKCCENGGICVMGVFCHCPKNFFGFRCEHEMRRCGPIEHESWAKVGCHLCRCYDSQLMCLPRAYSGCDDKPIKEEIQVSDYEDSDIHVFPPDETTIDPFYADYYDDRNGKYEYYDDDTSTSSPSSSSSSSSLSFSSSFSSNKILSSTYNYSITSHYSKIVLFVLISLFVMYSNNDLIVEAGCIS